MLAGQWASLLRLAVFMTVASAAVASLVLFLPVRVYYRTVDLADSAFDVEVDALITPEIQATVDRFADPDSAISFITVQPATVVANGHTADAIVYFTETPGRLNGSWFPDSTTVESAEVTGSSWIDLSAQVARDLDVGPGQAVQLPLFGRDVPLTVRRILAVARLGYPYVAVGPIGADVRAALSRLQFGLTPTVLLFRTSSSTETIRAAIDQVSPSGKTQVLTRAEWLDSVQIDPMYAEPVRGVATALGVFCLLGLAIREGHALFRRRRHDVVVMLAIGADRRKVTATLMLLEAAAISVALIAAWWFVLRVAYRELFAAALPPAFTLPLLLGLLAGGIAYVATAGLTSWRRLSRFDVSKALSEP